MMFPETISPSTVDQSVHGDPSGREYPAHDEIARLAYEYYIMRGGQEGHDVEDWLMAERELARLQHEYQEFA